MNSMNPSLSISTVPWWTMPAASNLFNCWARLVLVAMIWRGYMHWCVSNPRTHAWPTGKVFGCVVVIVSTKTATSQICEVFLDILSDITWIPISKPHAKHSHYFSEIHKIFNIKFFAMHTRSVMKVSEKNVEVEKVHMIHLELLQQQTPCLTIRLLCLRC